MCKKPQTPDTTALAKEASTKQPRGHAPELCATCDAVCHMLCCAVQHDLLLLLLVCNQLCNQLGIQQHHLLLLAYATSQVHDTTYQQPATSQSTCMQPKHQPGDMHACRGCWQITQVRKTQAYAQLQKVCPVTHKKELHKACSGIACALIHSSCCAAACTGTRHPCMQGAQASLTTAWWRPCWALAKWHADTHICSPIHSHQASQTPSPHACGCIRCVAPINCNKSPASQNDAKRRHAATLHRGPTAAAHAAHCSYHHPCCSTPCSTQLPGLQLLP